jgi:TetR/AcrR family transcriptional repressor of nem operon
MGRPSDAKGKLLQVAFDLIWKQSYGSVSVDHICARAAVNKGSFYHFFPSKADLAIEAYEEHWREKQPELDRIFSPQLPPLERLELWCKTSATGNSRRQKNTATSAAAPTRAWAPNWRRRMKKSGQDPGDGGPQHPVYRKRLDGCQASGTGFRWQPARRARRVHSVVLGILLHAKIHNDLEVLQDLEPPSWK